MALTVLEIETAIKEVLEVGQTVTHDGTTFNLPDLAKLYAMQTELSSSQARSTTRPMIRGFNFDGMGY